MKIPKLSLFMLIAVILALLHVSGCLRHITGCCTSSEEIQEMKSKPILRAEVFTEYRPLNAGSRSAGSRYKKMKHISSVAHKAVPTGPNPLHN